MSLVSFFKSLSVNTISGSIINDVIPERCVLFLNKDKNNIGWCIKRRYHPFHDMNSDFIAECFDYESDELLIQYSQKLGYPVARGIPASSIRKVVKTNLSPNIGREDALKKSWAKPKSERKFNPNNRGLIDSEKSKALWNKWDDPTKKHIIDELQKGRRKWEIENSEKDLETKIKAGKKGGKFGSINLLECNQNIELQKDRSKRAHESGGNCPTCGEYYQGVNRTKHFESCRLKNTFEIQYKVYEYMGFRFIRMKEVIEEAKNKFENHFGRKLGDNECVTRTLRFIIDRVENSEYVCFYGSGQIGSYNNADFVLNIANNMIDENIIAGKSKLARMISDITEKMDCKLSASGIRTILRTNLKYLKIKTIDGRNFKKN
jgi:hypothetical protein